MSKSVKSPAYDVLSRSADISACRKYRYQLERGFVPEPVAVATVTWVMLNPSTADGTVDDATIRRCMGFSTAWGYHHMKVVNLYAFRATKPADLWRADDPVGPENFEWVDRAAQAASRVILAWGAHGARDGRGAAMEQRLCERFQDSASTLVMVMGRTKGKEPVHPLYLPADTFPMRAGRI